MPRGDRGVSGAAYSDLMRRRLVLGAALLATGLLGPSQALARAPLAHEPATIVSVHDGDTIQVRISGRKEKVRLLGIDAPEMNDERPEYRAAAVAARDYATSLLAGRHVTLEADPIEPDRDPYDRLLRYVILPDGTNLNEQLVRKGYARVYNRFEFSEKTAFKKVEKAAREAKLGIWALPPGPARVVPEER